MPQRPIPSVDRRGLSLGVVILGLMLFVILAGLFVLKTVPRPEANEEMALSHPSEQQSTPPVSKIEKDQTQSDRQETESTAAPKESDETDKQINGIKIVYDNFMAQMNSQYQLDRMRATKESVRHVEKAATLYAVDHDAEYPESMKQLVEPELVNGIEKEPYLDKPPLDAWKNLIQYQPPRKAADKPLIWSYGPDKQEGGGDDITNRDE